MLESSKPAIRAHHHRQTSRNKEAIEYDEPLEPGQPPYPKQPEDPSLMHTYYRAVEEWQTEHQAWERIHHPIRSRLRSSAGWIAKASKHSRAHLLVAALCVFMWFWGFDLLAGILQLCILLEIPVLSQIANAILSLSPPDPGNPKYTS